MYVLGDRPVMHKRQLHGMFEDEKRSVQHKIINTEYENIYNGIIQNAKIGKSEIKFKLLCANELTTAANVKTSVLTDDEISQMMKMYQLSAETLSYKIVDKLKTTFPDSHIVYKPSENPDKCLIYTLSW
jgi:hypothetical protein